MQMLRAGPRPARLEILQWSPAHCPWCFRYQVLQVSLISVQLENALRFTNRRREVRGLLKVSQVMGD